MNSTEGLTKDGMYIKESTTHAGHFYKFNPADGTSEWLPRIESQKLKSGRFDVTKMDTTLKSGGLTPAAAKRAGNILNPEGQPLSFNGSSRYKEDFPTHAVQLRKSMAPTMPPVTQTPAAPDHFRTKYGEDFLFHVPSPPSSMKPKVAAPMAVPFTGTTTNQELHGPKPVEPYVSAKPRPQVKQPLPFDATTTNREQFVPHREVKPPDAFCPPMKAIPNLPFESSSHYHETFPFRTPENVRRRAPPHKPYEYGPPRGLDTEQRRAFSPKRSAIKLKPVTPEFPVA